MKVWLHEWEGNEWGWNAWSLNHLGFATWAPSRDEVLNRTPCKFGEYRMWLDQHENDIPAAESKGIIVAEAISGNEVAFEYDFILAEPEEIMRCLELLKFSRQGLPAIVEVLPESLLDWDPPYQRFANWARWRTIRQILEHIALTEVGYYLPNIGFSGKILPWSEAADWRKQLSSSRRETEQFLADLITHNDRARISETDEVWSVRKVLRRLIWHELLHWKSIKRIVREYKEQIGMSI